jgi:hypothetical protein
MRANVQGVVYLLHLDPPYRHARHYLGWSESFTNREAAHLNGYGARLLQVAREAGCTWRLAATWPGTRALERRLKRCGGRERFCPICNPDHPRRPRGTAPMAAPATSYPAVTLPDPASTTVRRIGVTECPGVSEYGHGLTLRTVHLGGCCERWAQQSAASSPAPATLNPDEPPF